MGLAEGDGLLLKILQAEMIDRLFRWWSQIDLHSLQTLGPIGHAAKRFDQHGAQLVNLEKNLSWSEIENSGH